MIITAMTATFGTLQGASLTLQPGMNLLNLPNEAGKSTWAAFLTAMLYGISTSERASKTGIPAKTRYLPWSGKPMEGVLEVIWQDRPLRIARTSGPQGPMAEFQAVWQDSGEAVAGMTGDNCGEMLMGVTRAVFERSALIRQSALTVTQSPDLEQRLGALVTTGDANTSFSSVSRTLKDWRNQRQYHNSGLLPTAMARLNQLNSHLADVSNTNETAAAGDEELTQLTQQRQALSEQLKQASEAAGLEVTIADALEEMQRTERAASALREQVLPPLNEIDQLLQNLDAIEKDAQALAARPRTADGVTGGVQLAVFKGLTREQAAEKAESDARTYHKLHRSAIWERISPVVSILAFVLAIVSALLLRVTFAYVVSGLLIVFGIAFLAMHYVHARSGKQAQADAILAAYGVEDEQGIYAAAESYMQSITNSTASASFSASKAELSRRVSAIRKAVAQLGRSDSIRGCRDTLQAARLRRIKLDKAEDAARQAKVLYERLMATAGDTSQNAANVNAASSRDAIATIEAELSKLDTRIDQLRGSISREQGRIAALGAPEELQQQIEATNQEIDQLRMELTALDLAQEALTTAAGALQSRVFPQLTTSASNYISRMTQGKYEQVIVDRELNISARSTGSAMDRRILQLSSGTADQLYLALRLAICDAALPGDAPVILDDALLSFDDERLEQAMLLLQELSARRQILLFSCTGRELAWNQALESDV